MAVQNIPVVDLREWEKGGTPRERFVAAVGESLADTGFFAVSNHGVPDTLTQHVYEVAKAFFHLPADVKVRYGRNGGGTRLHYHLNFSCRDERLSYPYANGSDLLTGSAVQQGATLRCGLGT
jgi:isopenicillin N synthase-like dioxygenase